MRQPKTAPPKTKFNSDKLYTCYRCKQKTNTYHVEQVDGAIHVVHRGGCPQ